VEPDAVEIRVLGCLIEKQRTTPDAYPLSTNAVRLACNQSTNRDPVVAYDEETVTDGLHRLGARGWARGSSGHSFRTRKYRHLLDEALGLAPDELAVLCVLMLRGVQTAGEIKQRTARMQDFADLDAVEDTIIRLADRELLVALPLRPGQKEVRFEHLMGGVEDDLPDAEALAASEPAGRPAATRDEAPAAPAPADPVAVPGFEPVPATAPPSAPTSAPASAPAPDAGEELRAELAELRAEVHELRDALDALRAELGA
jgi:uncharacterized protein YceH (UPF0502 family)